MSRLKQMRKFGRTKNALGIQAERLASLSLFLSSYTCRNMILNRSVHVIYSGYFLIYYPSGC